MSRLLDFLNGIVFASMCIAGVLIWIVSDNWLQGAALIVAMALFIRAAIDMSKGKK